MFDNYFPLGKPSFSYLLLPISGLSTDPSQDASNEPSTLSYSVPIVYHYDNINFIPTYVPGRSFSRTPSDVTSIIPNSSPTTDLNLTYINKSSNLPFAVTSAEYYDNPISETSYVHSGSPYIASSFDPSTLPPLKPILSPSLVPSSNSYTDHSNLQYAVEEHFKNPSSVPSYVPSVVSNTLPLESHSSVPSEQPEYSSYIDQIKSHRNKTSNFPSAVP